MFRSIVVPLGHGSASDRGLAVGVALARRACLPLRLVTVCGPSGDRPAAEADLRDRAVHAFPVPCAFSVVQAERVEDGLLTAIAEQPDGLVVMGTRALHALGEMLLGSVAEALLVQGDRPLVLVGPHVDVERFPSPQNLVVGVDAPSTAEALVPAVIEWARCFCGRPWIVQVAARTAVTAGAGDAPSFVRTTAMLLADAGVEAEWQVLPGTDRTQALIAFTEELGGGVLAVATRRWADPDRTPWSSTARNLVRQSPYPVLVLPRHQGRGLMVPRRRRRRSTRREAGDLGGEAGGHPRPEPALEVGDCRPVPRP